MDENKPMSLRGRIVAGLFWGGWLRFIVGPVMVLVLMYSLSARTWLDHRWEIETFFYASLGIVPVGSAVGATVAYVTRPNQ